MIICGATNLEEGCFWSRHLRDYFLWTQINFFLFLWGLMFLFNKISKVNKQYFDYEIHVLVAHPRSPRFLVVVYDLIWFKACLAIRIICFCFSNSASRLSDMGIEEASKSAVESCHSVLDLISKTKDQIEYGNLSVKTEESVAKFKKVVSILDVGLGHARARKSKNLQTPCPRNILLDNPIIGINYQPTAYQLPPTNSGDISTHGMGTNAKNNFNSEKLSLESSSSLKPTTQIVQQTPQQSNYQFHLHPLQQKFQQHQQLKQPTASIFQKSNSTSCINLNFEKATCTPSNSMSSTRSFMSSLNGSGSATNLDGTAFRLIGETRSLDQGSYQHKRSCPARGEGGRCHCSKNRFVITYTLFLITHILQLILYFPLFLTESIK